MIRVNNFSPVSLSVFSLVPHFLFDCLRVLEYLKKRTALQSIPPQACKITRITREYKEFFLLESEVLGFGIQICAQGTRNPANDWNLESKFNWYGIHIQIQNPRQLWIRAFCLTLWAAIPIFIAIKRSFEIRKELNSHRTGLGKQQGLRFIVWGNQHGRHFIVLGIQ